MNLTVFHIYPDTNQVMRKASLRERIMAQLIDGIILGVFTSILLLLFSRGQLYAVWISPMFPFYLVQFTEGYFPHISDWWWGGYYWSFSLPYLADLNVVLPSPLQMFYYAVYYFYFHSQFGQTPGKMMKGLVVLDNSAGLVSLRKSIWRWITYIVSIVPVGIGFWILSDQKNRRTWHDQLAGTEVFNFLDRGD